MRKPDEIIWKRVDKDFGTFDSMLREGKVMIQEVLTAVTYLVVWLICEKVIGIESGLTKLLISLGAAVGVYILMAFKEHKEKDQREE